MKIVESETGSSHENDEILYSVIGSLLGKPSIFEKIQKIQVGRNPLPALVGCLKLFSLEERRINYHKTCF